MLNVAHVTVAAETVEISIPEQIKDSMRFLETEFHYPLFVYGGIN